MQVYAQSQVPRSAPYVHLGYTAASSRIDSAIAIGLFGGAMLCLAALVIIDRSRDGAAGTKRKVAVAGSATLLVAGVAAVVITLVSM